MYNLRGEIKSYIVREGRTMEEVVTMLKEMYNRSGSVSQIEPRDPEIPGSKGNR